MADPSDPIDNDDASAEHRLEHRCLGCGYGIAVAEPPVSCPMCSGSTWMWPTPGAGTAVGVELLANGTAVVAPIGPLDEAGRSVLRLGVERLAARGIEVLVDLREPGAADAVDAPLLRELAQLAQEVGASLVASTDPAAVDVVRADVG
jgi:hypothetical protein